MDERELVSCTESIGKVKEGLHRYSSSLFSNSGSTFTTFSGCLFVVELSSVEVGVILSGGGVEVPINEKKNMKNSTHPIMSCVRCSGLMCWIEWSRFKHWPGHCVEC